MSDAPPIATKTANALIEGAQPVDALNLIAGVAQAASSAAGGTGGLWVGGKAMLYPDRLTFQPNDLNRSLHAGDVSAAVPLSSITAVIDRFGLLSGIVEVQTSAARTFKLRCFGAKDFSARIRETAGLPAV